MSAKWTAVSFFGLTALGAASFAFAGCTVTSGGVDNTEGGTTIIPGADAATDTDAADAAVATNQCPQNTKQTIGTIVSAACQSAIEAECCTPLATCFDIDPTTTDAGVGALDCNKYADCTAKCNAGPEAEGAACQNECELATPPSIAAAYDALFACIKEHPASKAACLP